MTTPELELNFGEVDPVQFAQIVAAMPDEQLAEGMASEARGTILDEIFRRMEEHFDPTQSADLTEIVNFVITGGPNGEPDRFQVVIKDDKCCTTRNGTEQETLTLELDGASFLKVTAGIRTGMDLYLEGKLKIDGSMIKATRLAGLFAIPDGGDSAAGNSSAGGQ